MLLLGVQTLLLLLLLIQEILLLLLCQLIRLRRASDRRCGR